MFSTNIWHRFRGLLPVGSLTLATIVSNNGNGTSQARLRDGTVVTVKGEQVAAGEKAVIREGEVKGAAADLTHYEVEI